MARTDTLTHFLTDVASAIKTKKGSQESIQASNFDTEIANLPSAGKYAPSYVSFHSFNGDDLSDELSNLDTSNITEMLYTFSECGNLSSLDLSDFDTSNVTTIDGMFSFCYGLSSLDISSFDTSKVTNMVEVFMNCESLTTIDVSNFDFSNVEQMNDMFSGCANLETITLPNNISLDTMLNNMSSMFDSCLNLDTTTLNQILYMCTTVGEHYQGEKSLEYLGINSDFVNYDEIPNLSNYQDFLDAGWTLMAE